MEIDGFDESFIGHILRRTPDYGFIPHLSYFLENRNRWSKSDQILHRIYAKVPEDIKQAWEIWRQFRSAQAEITAIFLIENYFSGYIKGLEAARHQESSKTCDIYALFGSDLDFYFEVKAQSGQQDNDKHPLCYPQVFESRFESDLYSWLFERKISSRDGKPMRPYCLQASDKSADALIVMTDIFNGNYSMDSLAGGIIPDYKKMTNVSFSQRIKNDIVRVISIIAGQETVKKMGSLNEIWIFDNSSLEKIIIVHLPERRLSVLGK